MISLIAAMDEDRGIGRKGSIPWHIPEDLRHFKDLTMGHPIIMGRRTFESIGRVLPGRPNIIISRNLDNKTVTEGVSWAASLEDAINLAKEKEGSDEVFIIGGGQIYKEALSEKIVDKIYLTVVKGKHDADTFFPELTGFEEKEVGQKKNEKYEYSFNTYIKNTT